VKNQRGLVFLSALVLMAGTIGALTWLKAHQKLGQPGVKFAPITGSVVVKIDLPAQVLDFTSTNIPESKVLLDNLPRDTSYAERIYTGADGFQVQATMILMGTDRSSIHNADVCLSGEGFSGKKKAVVTIPIAGPQPYQMPVARWDVSGGFQQPGGRSAELHGVYVFWFVADGEETPDYHQRMIWLGRDLLCTGVLQRWAYLSYFAICPPGQEDATFERMKNLIASSVPEYQLPPASLNMKN
jgi:hypothetical protein